MSKYDALHTHLSHQPAKEVPMSFADVESVVGFTLPPSARSQRAWWSNNEGTNVAVKSWRRAGWKTARVDMAGEKVTFVREPASAPAKPATDARGEVWSDEPIVLRRSDLPNTTNRVLEKYIAENGGDVAAAIAAMLRPAVIKEQMRVIDESLSFTPNVGPDSTPWIREDRDAR